MTPETIRTLPFGTGVTLLRSTRPIITDLRVWTRRPEGKQLTADRASIELQLQSAGSPSRAS